VQNLPTQLVIYGVAAYSLNLELSLNIAASIEGWFDDHWSWQWIFWDTALLAPLTLVCIRFGMPRRPVNRELLKNADWAGMLYASVGFSLLYAGLDQGNRLDWLNSGLINALLLGGILLLVVFVVHELTYKRPWINLRFAASGNMPLLFLFISFFRFIILSTSYIIPQYLITVQNYRAIEIGVEVGRAAAVPGNTAGGDDSAVCRRQGDDGARLCARGLRVFFGRAAYSRLGRRRLFALTVFTGSRPIARSDFAGLVRLTTPGAK
jgi:MFS family permease